MSLFRRSMQERIERLLDDEFQALMGGRFDALATILKEKEVLFSHMESLTVKKSELIELQDKAERNQAMLNAAQAGIRNAVARISSIIAKQDGFQTYDELGHKSPSTQQSGKLKRRA